MNIRKWAILTVIILVTIFSIGCIGYSYAAIDNGDIIKTGESNVHTINTVEANSSTRLTVGTLKVLYRILCNEGMHGSFLYHYGVKDFTDAVVLRTDHLNAYIWPFGTPNKNQQVVIGSSKAVVDLRVSGNLSKGGGSFMIDHPLDPENKILRHSFVESPDMMLIYKGRDQLKNKEAVIKLPDYFNALNRDDNMEYSLTPINSLCRLGIKKEVNNNEFIVFGDEDCKFSWVVYSVRDDAYAKVHPIVVEEEKKESNGCKPGECLHKEACE